MADVAREENETGIQHDKMNRTLAAVWKTAFNWLIAIVICEIWIYRGNIQYVFVYWFPYVHYGPVNQVCVCALFIHYLAQRFIQSPFVGPQFSVIRVLDWLWRHCVYESLIKCFLCTVATHSVSVGDSNKKINVWITELLFFRRHIGTKWQRCSSPFRRLLLKWNLR